VNPIRTALQQNTGNCGQIQIDFENMGELTEWVALAITLLFGGYEKKEQEH